MGHLLNYGQSCLFLNVVPMWTRRVSVLKQVARDPIWHLNNILWLLTTALGATGYFEWYVYPMA